jgi:hypothetical protein
VPPLRDAVAAGCFSVYVLFEKLFEKLLRGLVNL